MIIAQKIAQSIYDIVRSLPSSRHTQSALADEFKGFRSKNAILIIARAAAAKSEADALSILQTLGTVSNDVRCQRIVDRYHRDHAPSDPHH